MTESYGIDISKHVSNIVWDEIPDIIKIVGIKATEGIGYEDPSFQQHIENALEKKKLVVPYHFYRTKVGSNISDPTEQAEWYLSVIAQYKNDLYMRALDVERGPYDVEKYGGYYNPYVSTIMGDLRKFQTVTKKADWSAFDLLYTGVGTWDMWKLQSPTLLEKLKLWISDGLADGLWLAFYPYGHPTKLSDLPYEYQVPSRYYPYPFTEHFMHQIGDDVMVPGVYTDEGIARGVDFNILPYSMEVILSKLGISPSQTEDTFESASLRVLISIESLLTEVRDLIAKGENDEETSDEEETEEETEEEVEEEVEDWKGWQTRDMSQWPKTVDGLRVAYVKVTKEKLPLWVPNKDMVPIPYENTDLLPWGKDDRINLFEDDVVMVYRDGPNDYKTPHPDVNTYKWDGGNQVYLVMKEQEQGNPTKIKLWENEAITVPLYISAEHTYVVYVP